AITIADVDAGAASLTVTITTDGGTLTATAGGAATVTGSGTASLQLDGTVADLVATLDTLVFTAPGAPQNITITVAAAHHRTAPPGAGGETADSTPGAAAVPANPMLDAPAGPFAFTTSIGGTSPVQSFMVSGGNLTGSITVTAPAAFEISDAVAGTYGATA